MISDFAGVRPEVAGKPERPLFDETFRRVGGRRPLMVGDSLDTDIAGAHRAETDSLLVMTGVTAVCPTWWPRGPTERPTWVGHDLRRSVVRAARRSTATGRGGRWAGRSTRRTGGSSSTVGGHPDGWWAVVGGCGLGTPRPDRRGGRRVGPDRSRPATPSAG